VSSTRPSQNLHFPLTSPLEISALPEPDITLSVVSEDKELLTLCREVLSQLTGSRWSLQAYGRLELIPSTDVCLWDYEAGAEVPAPEKADQKVFFVVPPQHIETFRNRVPWAEGNILLAPVTRAVLQAFLGSVSSTRSNPTLSEIGNPRADRDELLQCLLQANLRLQEYDRQRTNFIARAVHDFRAPLTAMSGFCGLLADGELGSINPGQREALHRMQHAAKRLSRMATAMFDLSIGPQMHVQPDLREGDIRECIKQAMHEILPLAAEKEIPVEAVNILPPSAPLHFDASQIEQVLINLLDNACKFTPSGGLIEITGYPYFWERRFLAGGRSRSGTRRSGSDGSPNSYRVDVKDTGSGVPPDQVDRIFEEYTSYAGSKDRSGGGLGLAICRMILSRHQGCVWVDSTESGAAFSFVLPYNRRSSQEGVRNPLES
jgi:signal transduction histidine kinase